MAVTKKEIAEALGIPVELLAELGESLGESLVMAKLRRATIKLKDRRQYVAQRRAALEANWKGRIATIEANKVPWQEKIQAMLADAQQILSFLDDAERKIDEGELPDIPTRQEINTKLKE